MAFIDGLPENEREALEQGFREHLAGTVTGIVAKRFDGGETWCADLIIRTEALAYLNVVYSDFEPVPNSAPPQKIDGQK